MAEKAELGFWKSYPLQQLKCGYPHDCAIVLHGHMPFESNPLYVIIDEDDMSHVAKYGPAQKREVPDPFKPGEVMTTQVSEVVAEPNAVAHLTTLPSADASGPIVQRILSDPEMTSWVVLEGGLKIFWLPYWMTEEFPEVDQFYSAHFDSLGESAIPHVLLVVPQT